jgi:hypothetical protein
LAVVGGGGGCSGGGGIISGVFPYIYIYTRVYIHIIYNIYIV